MKNRVFIFLTFLVILIFSCQKNEEETITPKIEIEKKNVIISPQGEKISLNVFSTVKEWTFETEKSGDNDWFKIDKTDGLLEISAEMNDLEMDRSLQIKVIAINSNGRSEDYVKLTQAAMPYLNLSDEDIYIDCQAQSITLPISFNTDFDVVIDSDWLVKRVHYDDYIRFYATYNDTNESRKANIELSLKQGSTIINIFVIQSATYGLYSDSLALSSIAEQKDSPVYYKWRGPIHSWEGVVIEEIEGEKRVTGLDISGNSFSPIKLTEEMKYLTGLKSLKLYGSARGDIMKMILNYPLLEDLNLIYPLGANGNIANLANLEKLKNVKIHGDCSITGALPSEISRLKDLESLELSFISIYGSIPSEIGSLVKLQKFELHENSLTGEIPSEIGNLKDLRKLTISNNKITGELPQTIRNLINLEELTISLTSVYGEIPDEINKLSKLVLLNLTESDFSGNLPLALNELRELERLNLSKCRFEGTFFDKIRDLTKLTSISIRENKFNDEVPSEIYKLKYLEDLHIGDNNFFGTLPEEMGRMEIKSLRIQNNRFSGALPQTFFDNPFFYTQWNPVTYIFPQQPGYGFTNID